MADCAGENAHKGGPPQWLLVVNKWESAGRGCGVRECSVRKFALLATAGKLAGYEDVNDAERLSVDPAMRHVVAGGRLYLCEGDTILCYELRRGLAP